MNEQVAPTVQGIGSLCKRYCRSIAVTQAGQIHPSGLGVQCLSPLGLLSRRSRT